MSRLSCALIVTALCAAAGPARADDERRLQIGMRSALIASTMELSKLDRAFGDLTFDGITGAHHSTIFGLYQLRPYVRVGFETLVGNADADAETTMDFQAAGPVGELFYRRGRWIAAGGLHVGSMLASAMHRDDAPADSGVQTGTYVKTGALFAAPYASVGVIASRFELRLFAKQVWVGAGERPNASAFSALYIGVSGGYAL